MSYAYVAFFSHSCRYIVHYIIWLNYKKLLRIYIAVLFSCFTWSHCPWMFEISMQLDTKEGCLIRHYLYQYSHHEGVPAIWPLAADSQSVKQSICCQRPSWMNRPYYIIFSSCFVTLLTGQCMYPFVILVILQHVCRNEFLLFHANM